MFLDVAIDVARVFIDTPAYAYALVFTAEAALFIWAAAIGTRVRAVDPVGQQRAVPGFGDVAVAQVLQGR